MESYRKIDGNKVYVLDYGYVRAVHAVGTDETVIDSARMSTAGGFVSWEPYEGHPRGDAGLLEYLYKERHSTPYEFCVLAVEAQLPIFVMRELVRHRLFSISEFSSRYSEMPDLHYTPPPVRIRGVPTSNKQGSGALLPETVRNTTTYEMQNDQVDLRKSYERYLKSGVAKEIARVNTPVSAYTKARIQTSLRGWLHFLELRMASNAQEEIRDYANAVASIVKQLWPRTYALFEEYTLYAKTLSRTELELLRELVDPASLSASLRAKIHG